MAKNLFEVVQALLMLAALLAVTAACVGQGGRPPVRRGFVRGLVAVFALALVLAFLRDRRIIKYNQIYNVYLLVASAASGLTFCALLWAGVARKEPSASVGGACAAAGLLLAGTLILYRLPTIAVMPFHFLGKDESYFSTYYLSRLTGFLLALLALALFFLALYRILSRAGARTRAAFATALYLMNGFASFVGIVGIINSYYRRKFPLPPGLRRSLPRLIAAEDAVLLAAVALLAVLAAAFAAHNVRIHGEYGNPAQHRRLRMIARNNRRWGAFLFALLAFTWADLTAVRKASNRIVELSPSEEYEMDGADIFIPLTQVGDGHLHRFTWTNAKGKAIRFIIVQKQGMNFGIGFDACEICGNVGYYERKNEVICNRCDVVMNKSTIGLKGGCNPIPLDSRIERGGIIISTDDLDKEAKRF